MYSAYFRQTDIPGSGRNRQRTIAFILALIVHILVIILFLLVNADPLPLKEAEEPNTFVLSPDRGDKTQHTKPRKAKAAAAAHASPPDPHKNISVPRSPIKSQLLVPLSAEDFAASDISKLPTKSSDSANGQSDSASASGPGQGPGGVRLFDAEWYRRPTDAELAGYMPANVPPHSWGLVACKTIENYRVDNCQALGESPLGSGLARAVREAAWQFRVLPPRVDGRPLVGAWVRIRIDYAERARG